MKTIVIIQARMGSSRLPGKILLPLGDSCVLDYVVSRSRLIASVQEVIVATSVLPSDDAIANWCAEHRIACFRGSEQNVLSRFYECAAPYEPDYVIRVTSDCPFVDYGLASEIVRAMEKQPSDIALLEGKLPRGLAVEMISHSALTHIQHAPNEERHREHVTYYAYEYAEQFSSTTVSVPSALRHPELRITLDTAEDYALCRAAANAFKGDMAVPSAQVIGYLLATPEVAKLNAHIEQKPVV
ncbi:NTP transferase domain-containing protein [Paenibacillus sp. KS-LC4]|uniref:cytidylyltransferase domain-containing protein n=1 Tax=Paenibacillus sp. KS-LC4 TaxID=2979727 RepID=UPI0030CC6C34